MPASKIRHNLARFRDHLGLNQSEVAGCVGASHSAIRAVENLKLPLSVSLAEKLEAVFGIQKEWLLANNLSAPIPELKQNREYTGWAGIPLFGKKDIAIFQVTKAFRILATLKDDRSFSLFHLATTKYIQQLEHMFGAPEEKGSYHAVLKEIVAALDSELARVQGKPPRSRKPPKRKAPRRSRVST